MWVAVCVEGEVLLCSKRFLFDELHNAPRPSTIHHPRPKHHPPDPAHRDRSDEMDDFIDDGEGEEGRRRRRRAASSNYGFSSQAMAEAARIFGDATVRCVALGLAWGLRLGVWGLGVRCKRATDDDRDQGLLTRPHYMTNPPSNVTTTTSTFLCHQRNTNTPQDLHDLVASRRAVQAAAVGEPGSEEAPLEDEEAALAAELGDDYDDEAVMELRWGGRGLRCYGVQVGFGAGAVSGCGLACETLRSSVGLCFCSHEHNQHPSRPHSTPVTEPNRSPPPPFQQKGAPCGSSARQAAAAAPGGGRPRVRGLSLPVCGG